MPEVIIFKVSLPILFKKRPKYYVVYCPILDVTTQGETKKKAIANIKEATQLFLINCFERGTLDKVLKECGFTALKKSPSKKQTSNRKQIITVPLPFIINSQQAKCQG